MRGCFALWKRTCHCLSLAFDYQMRADLVVSTIELVEFSVPGTIFHSDQGSQYGAEQTRTALLTKGFVRSRPLIFNVQFFGYLTDEGLQPAASRCGFIPGG